MIGLSPLPTSHPKIFQHLLVRTSTTSYCRFILDMGRSPGFTSAARNLFALFRLAFATGTSLKDLALLRTSNSLAHYAKGTLSSRSRPKSGGLQLIVGIRFQVLLTPLPGCFSPFPHGTIPLSVTREYLALPDGPGRFLQDFSCPAVLGRIHHEVYIISPTGLSPSADRLSRLFGYDIDF